MAEYQQARALYEQALPLYREIGDRLGEANTLKSLGDLNRQEGKLEESRSFYEQALQFFRAISDQMREADTLRALASLSAVQGDTTLALNIYSQALGIYQQIQFLHGTALTLREIAEIHIQEGASKKAVSRLEESLDILTKIGSSQAGEVENTLAELRAETVQEERDTIQSELRSKGDFVGGDKVAGDAISVGDISGSVGVAIGRGAHAYVTEGPDTAEIAKAFAEIVLRLEALDADPADIEDTKAIVEEIKREVSKGDEADESSLALRLRYLARIGPDILDVVTATLVNPSSGVALVVRKLAAKARTYDDLDPL